MITRIVVAAALALALPAPAQNLRIAMQGAPTTLDPHWLLNLGNTSHLRNIYDTLTVRDPDLQVGPGLAESWRIIDETTWEFRLRQGVRFHDGSPLTTADVVATFARVPNVQGNPNAYTVYLAGIAGVEAVDAHTLRIRTEGPLPMLPVNLSTIFIVPAAQAQRPNADFNSGQAAIGSGPYRVVSWSNGQPLVLRRNDATWGPRPAWEQVSFRPITNDPARVAALLAGDVDFINNVPQQDVARLSSDPRMAMFRGPSAYVVNVWMDIERPNLPGITDPAGNPLGRNPFTDVRVRRAMSLALPREAIAERVLENSAEATDQPVPRTFFGAFPDRRPAPQDVARARALLTEAGQLDAFRVTLFCLNERMPRICESIAAAWTRIGIRTEVELIPRQTYLPRRNRREYGVFAGVFGSLTGEASYMLGAQVHTPGIVPALGTLNFTGLSFPDLDQIIRTARATLDDGRRAEMLRQVTQRVIDEALIVPVVVFRSTAAGRANLAYRTRADEEILAAEIRPR
jgi:peptide/nickel transport system substrate-binding protein